MSAGVAVRGPSLRALLWLGGGIVAYGVIESVLSPRLDRLLPEGGWGELGVSGTIFIPAELAGLLVTAAVLAALAAIASAVILWRGYSLSRSLPVDFAYLGARLLVASWPLEAYFLFVRGGHVPGSPSGWTMTLVLALILACQSVTLWQVRRARRDFRAREA